MTQGSRIPLYFAVLTPLWLLGLIFPPTLDYDNKDTLQFVSLFWLFAAALLYGREHFLYPAIQRQNPSIRVCTFLFFIVITISAALSTNARLSLGYVGITVIGLMCCAGLWTCLKDRIRQCLSLYAIIGSALMVYVYLTAPVYQGRLSFSAVSHPNHLALIAFGILVSSLAMRGTVLKCLLVSVNLVVILATQARGALLASVIAILVHLYLSQIYRYKRSAIIFFGVLGSLSLGGCLLYEEAIQNAITNLLFLNDRYRGVGTGFTGRIEAWQEAYQLFVDNPLFGIGFRMHEQYMTTLSSAHNGYLSMLAETGALGVICAGALTFICVRRLFRMALKGDMLAITGFSMVLGYLFLAVFERFFINVGNPTSILVWLLLFMPPRRSSTPHWSTVSSESPLPGNYQPRLVTK